MIDGRHILSAVEILRLNEVADSLMPSIWWSYPVHKASLSNWINSIYDANGIQCPPIITVENPKEMILIYNEIFKLFNTNDMDDSSLLLEQKVSEKSPQSNVPFNWFSEIDVFKNSQKTFQILAQCERKMESYFYTDISSWIPLIIPKQLQVYTSISDQIIQDIKYINDDMIVQSLFNLILENIQFNDRVPIRGTIIESRNKHIGLRKTDIANVLKFNVAFLGWLIHFRSYQEVFPDLFDADMSSALVSIFNDFVQYFPFGIIACPSFVIICNNPKQITIADGAHDNHKRVVIDWNQLHSRSGWYNDINILIN